MSEEVIIRVENLGKRYSIRHERERYTALRDVIAEKAKGLFRPRKAKRKAQSERSWRSDFRPRTSDLSFCANE